jgi:hypothetical protein
MTKTEKIIGGISVTLLIAFIIAVAIGSSQMTSEQFDQMNKNAPKYSYGVNGLTEQRCVNGFWFMFGHSGTPTQLLDSNGKPMRCE